MMEPLLLEPLLELLLLEDDELPLPLPPLLEDDDDEDEEDEDESESESERAPPMAACCLASSICCSLKRLGASLRC